jgi:alkyldihydroxyacetonephosphate synthase
MGHEGNFGIITEAVMRIRKIPDVKRYGSIIFPDFELGIKFMDEMSRGRLWPASIRLVDNNQFQFGQALKPMPHSKASEFIDKIKKFYVLNIKGFNPNKMVACTLGFEGTALEVGNQEKNVYEVCKKYGGMEAGSENGIRGYFLTYMIAYIRDFAASYSFVAESFETSCPWSKVSLLCTSVNERLLSSCKSKGVNADQVFSSFRVT